MPTGNKRLFRRDASELESGTPSGMSGPRPRLLQAARRGATPRKPFLEQVRGRPRLDQGFPKLLEGAQRPETRTQDEFGDERAPSSASASCSEGRNASNTEPGTASGTPAHRPRLLQAARRSATPRKPFLEQVRGRPRLDQGFPKLLEGAQRLENRSWNKFGDAPASTRASVSLPEGRNASQAVSGTSFGTTMPRPGLP